MEMAWLQVGVMIATVLGTLGVFVQARIATRQTALQEVESARQERRAWSQLQGDWRATLIVGCGPERGAIIDPLAAASYKGRLVAYRDAHLAAWASDEHPGPGDETSGEVEDHFRRDIAAYGALSKDRAAVARILSHLCQVANFHFEGRISISAVYGAIGLDLVEHSATLRAVTRHAPDFQEGCVAGVYDEARLWRTLEIDELSSRLGWASVLGDSQASLARLDALMAALTIYAYRLGDLHGMREGSISVEDVGASASLARLWKAVAPVSRARAWRLCYLAAYYRERELARYQTRGGWRWPLVPSFLAFMAANRARREAKSVSHFDRWLPTAYELKALSSEYSTR